MIRRKIVLFFRRNKQKIIVLIGAILILILISFLGTIIISTVSKVNEIAMSNENKTESNIQNSIIPERNTAIYGEDISISEYKEDEEVIKQFLKYCNEKNIDKAYELLSDGCKNTYYSSKQEFKKLYYDEIFYVDKTYDIQSWISGSNRNTYKVKLYTDNFDLGKTDNSEYIEEYYTVITKDNKKKLSINKYIDRVNIDKASIKNNVKVNVKYKDMYTEYEIYTIEVTNNNYNEIILDSREYMGSTYLLDTNGTKYSSYIYENLDSDLRVGGNEKNTIKIKFNKMYNPNITIQSVNFIDIKYKEKRWNLRVDLQ